MKTETISFPRLGRMLCAFKECSTDIQNLVLELALSLKNKDMPLEEQRLVIDTIDEALFPEVYSEADNHDDDPCVIQSVELELDQEEATFSDRLREMMLKCDITQEDLAQRTGVRQSAIAMMLSRNCRPQRGTVRKLADALQVHPDDLWPVY